MGRFSCPCGSFFPITIFFSFSIPLGTPYGGAIESLGDRLPILPGYPAGNEEHPATV